MIRHVVLFKWKPEATVEQRAAAIARLRTLPGEIGEIRGFTVGGNVADDPENYDVALIAEFDDLAGFDAYYDHPAHISAAKETIAPILEHRSRLQIEI